MRDDTDQQARDDTDALLRAILRDVLGLKPEQVAGFDADTELFGALPELDSMAVAGLLTVGSSRVDLQACKLEYSIVSPK